MLQRRGALFRCEAESVVSVRDLVMRYGERDVLAGVGFDLNRGQAAASTQVRWSHGGERHVQSSEAPARFVHDLMVQHGDAITELEVNRPSLEDTYLTLVRRWESGDSPQDQDVYIFMGLGTLAYLWFNRDTEVEGTGLLLPSVALPSILGALVAFGGVFVAVPAGLVAVGLGLAGFVGAEVVIPTQGWPWPDA